MCTLRTSRWQDEHKLFASCINFILHNFEMIWRWQHPPVFPPGPIPIEEHHFWGTPFKNCCYTVKCPPSSEYPQGQYPFFKILTNTQKPSFPISSLQISPIPLKQLHQLHHTGVSWAFLCQHKPTPTIESLLECFCLSVHPHHPPAARAFNVPLSNISF